MMKRSLYLILLISSIGYGQSDSTYIDFSAYVKLDSIMITAKRDGFSVEEFIKVIQQDNSLEHSFNNLRELSYKYSNDITYFKNNGKVKAKYKSINVQHYNGKCQWMEVLEEASTGNYTKFYTSALYDRVFYKPTSPCADASEPVRKSRSKKILENRINELKKLIYTPGKEASIPLIGSKTAIFSEEMIQHYDFSIASKEDFYVFTASIKPVFNMESPDGSVVKYLEVVMRKGSFQVLERNYKLQYDAGIYNFDIVMKVSLSKFQDKYVPSDISYEGFWKVVGKRRENCRFYFKILEFLGG